MEQNELPPRPVFNSKFMKYRSITVIVSAAVIAAGIGFGGALVGSGFAARSGNAITVTGIARTSATADSVVWNLNISEPSQTASGAVAKVNNDSTSLTKYLTNGGVAADAITYGAVGTFANNKYVNGNDTGQILSYRATQTITVRSKDVKLIEKLNNGIGAILTGGANISNWGPQYYVSTLNDLRPKLLAEAMKDAKVRAESITSAVGSTVGAVLSVTSGPVQVTTPDSVDTSAGGMYDTTSIEKTVTVTVSVAFKTSK
jgi:hypothetical protein